MVAHSGAPQDARRVRPLESPKPITLLVNDAGLPAAVELRGRRVEATVRSRWRIDDEWWREVPIARLYYELYLDNGRLLTVFQDLMSEEWFAQKYA